jgi:tetratricopeptide (TPR) repeat protein
MSPHLVVRVIAISAACLLWIPSGFGQTTGGAPSRPPTGNSGTSTTGTATTTSSPSTSNSTGNSKTSPTYHTPIYLTGRVVLEEGGPPPEPATIERICNGQPHAEGYSDTHGNFAIQLGNESTVFQDASEEATRSSLPGATSSSNSSSLGSGAGTNPAYTKYQNCDLRAKLAGYRSQALSLANLHPLDDPNIGTILLHKEGTESGTTVSASALAAPRDSRRAYERGMQDLKKNKPDEAIQEFRKAVELYPEHAEAWYEIGRIQASRGESAAARQSFNASLKADPKFVNPYVQLSILTQESKDWQELGDLTDRGMRLDSFDFPQLFLFNAVANYNMHKFAAAEKSIGQAVRLDTEHHFPDIQRLSGMLLLLRKDYSAAAEQFRSYLKMSPDGHDAPAVRTQLAEIERITTQSAVSTPKDK